MTEVTGPSKCMHLNYPGKGHLLPCLLPTAKTLRIMKLIAVLMLAACLQVSAKGYSQRISLNVKDAGLEKIFKEIRKQGGFLFLYTDEMIRESKKVSINLKNVSLQDALEACFSDQPLTYTIVSRTIIVKRKVNEVPADQLPPTIAREIRGKVLDEEGIPVSGASVMISGTDLGTSTDVNGEFVIRNVPEGSYELIITSVGFSKLVNKVRVGNKEVTVNITLSKSASRLDEIVVTAYGTQRKSTMTGSVGTMSSKLLEHSPRASVQDNLHGNVSGVMVSVGSGQPGYSGNVRIRGIGSINAGNVPLYVVDGVPLIATDLNGINASDVASISVLKDASAASLYGSRAANGVILITTKKGNAGKTIISASAQAGFNNVTNSQNTKPLNTKEMLELMREGWVNSGESLADFKDELLDNDVDTTIDTDWFKELTRQGQYQQFDVSASGGSEKTRFFVSGSYYNSKAPLLGSDFKRYTAKVNVSNQATNKLNLSLGILASATKSNIVKDAGGFANPVRAYKRYQPWIRVYLPDGTYDLTYSNRYNPVAFVKENRFKQDRYNVLGNIGLKYTIVNGLTFENQNSVDFQYAENLDYAKSGIGTARTNGGIADYGTGRIINVVTTNILRYKKEFGHHGVEAFIGYEGQKVQTTGVTITKRNFIPNTYTLNNASILVDGGSTETNNSLTGAFSNLQYNFQSKYFVSASFRRDGSSRFGTDKKYGNFWSVGASWNITGEPFMTRQNLFTDLRLRASYGTNGNQSIDDFASRGLYSNTAIYDNNPGFSLTQYGNSILTWEHNKPFNVGLDFGILDSRIQGSLEYYVRTTSALLLERPVSATNGITAITQNIGAMQNSGFEVELSTINILPKEKDGFSWSSRFTFATMKNKITKLSSPITGSTYNRYEGGDFYQLYLVGFAGADPANGESLWYVDGSKSGTTNDYTKAKQFNQGSALPSFFSGLTNTFELKGVSLSFQLYGSFGNYIYDNWGSNSNTDGAAGFGPTSSLPRYYYENRWQRPGDQGKEPKVKYRGTQSGSTNHHSTRFMYEGDFIRLRDITLAFDLPGTVTERLKLGNARFYVRANNLYTYTKDDRITFDPEVGVDGLADQNAPVFKTLLIGLDLKF